VKIERMNKGPWGKVQAFFDVMTEEGFTIKGFKIIEGINGLFVSMPSQKGKDDEYFDTVYLAQELRQELTQLALQKYGMENESPDNFNFPNNKQTEAPTTNEESPQTIEKTTENESSNEPVTSDDDIPF
jgi:stage V sporulation protein G